MSIELGKFNQLEVVKEVAGTPAEQEELEKSYEHLCKLRDEVIEMGIIPAIKDWHALNPNID